MASSGSSSKKRSSDEDDFDSVRQYILACPLVANPTENAAVKAALAGLDQELKRRERDNKLHKKFAAPKTTETNNNNNNKQELDDEWQDIADDRKKSAVNRGASPEGDEVEFIDMEGDTSFLGKKLAEVAIASIAESHAKTRTPLASIAVALHAAMRSDVLGFACTGSAHDGDKANSGGFAPPIRELPKTQFLPKDWDQYASSSSASSVNTKQLVVLRYRKKGTGSVLLSVEISEQPAGASPNQEICLVKVVPANTKEPPSQSLSFPLGDHINLDSWTSALRASSGSSGVEPALHYKGLPALMTAFAKTFDLGSIHDEKPPTDGPATAFIGAHPAVSSSTEAFKKRNQEFAKPIYVGNGDQARGRGYDRPTIDNAFPPHRPMFVGDFSGDLVPGGPGSNPLRRGGPDSAGSLMGPNHPMFTGGGMSGVGDGSGFGMRPRFDPFGPPGGPQEIHPTGPDGRPLVGAPQRQRPRTSGEPNADHLRPPTGLGDNMFS